MFVGFWEVFGQEPRRFGQTKSTPLAASSSAQSSQVLFGWPAMGLNRGAFAVPV